MENLEIIIYKEKASTHGIMEGLTKDIGQTTKWKGTAYLLGPMVEFTKVNTLTIRRKARGFSPGLMAASTMENGRMGSRTAKGSILFQAANQKGASGQTAKESLGSEILFFCTI